ncbi:GntR family transcriptional regulator [Micromonospora sp. WMMA1363]|uniref:GntR family transcriptional regulator n=1 Tax=Micromonospora sp. WMMA1363 TaxID=3053985 RepID=UPI00259CF66B|nr:GntR family transcriptional regulator [Micromonospora sp. WMMA1363]MDM4721179.1 GntR family transcriptional regulator [Micromonospora sp. WMMA1363]MDM4723267.1 GntR family transcriptional regulator [Micromonospora sp. WMMA1363]
MTARDPRPRSHQIAAELRAVIMSGDLAPGAKLPSTAELMDQHRTHGATIQNALGILKAEGYLEGQPGRGVFVRPTQQQTITPADYSTPSTPGQPYAWITAAADRGQRGASQLLDVGEHPAPVQVAAAFGIDPGEPVVRRQQLLTLDGQPVELVWTFYPVALARGTPLTARRLIKGGAPAVLAELGVEPASIEDVISTRPPTSEEFVALALPTEVPILRTFRVVVAATGDVVECQLMVKAGHRHEVRYRWPA